MESPIIRPSTYEPTKKPRKKPRKKRMKKSKKKKNRYYRTRVGVSVASLSEAEVTPKTQLSPTTHKSTTPSTIHVQTGHTNLRAHTHVNQELFP